ncbi:MAG TPA: hypothetical protein VGG64_04520 [Pirellulales bacterium]|jgi:hypothetical protein|nr:hypothetical protein [Pirellulales bacterium]
MKSIILLLAFAGLLISVPACNRARPEEPASVVPASELRYTDVLPHGNGAIESGRSYVYCATFQLTWDELRKLSGDAPVRLMGDPPLAAVLNDHRFDRADLSPADYLAMSGRVNQGIVAEIRQAVATRFPRATLKVSEAATSDGLYLYTYLDKLMPFAEKFDRVAAIPFQAGGETAGVAAFGIEGFYSSSKRGRALAKQLSVLDYRGEDDFILRLNTTAKEDELILAKVAPHATLSETVAAVEQRIKEARKAVKWPGAEEFLYQPHDEEPLKIPIVSLAIDREYAELMDRPIENRELTGLPIVQARQRVLFHLDERGARLESNAWSAVKSEQTNRPRKYVFDKPFLLYVKKAGDHTPYFALWVGSFDLLRTK